MDGIEVRRMSPNEMDAACDVLALAFADNPNTLMVQRGDRAKGQRMMRTVARVAKLGRPCSHVLVAGRSGKIVGVLNAAEWPRCQMSGSEKLRSMPRMLTATGGGTPRALKMLSVWGERDPREEHWHLGPIGVHPEFQGQGIGKAMLSSFLETVDDQGSAAYLETDVDKNVVLYEKFGFVVTSEADILGVNNRFMWREASASPA